MNKQQLWVLRILAVGMLGDLLLCRIGLKYLTTVESASEYHHYCTLASTMSERVITIALLVFLGVVTNNLCRVNTCGALRAVIAASLGVVGVAAVSLSFDIATAWAGFVLQPITGLAVILIAADAAMKGTTISRAGVASAALALLCAAGYQIAETRFPGMMNVYWLRVLSEGFGALTPWLLAVSVQRRTFNDFIGLIAFAVVTPIFTYAIWDISPAVKNLLVQATGSRLGAPSIIIGMTLGAVAYFLVKAFRSTVIPRQIPWAFVLMISAGLTTHYVHCQYGTVIALAVFAWAPPSALPQEMNRTKRIQKHEL